MSLFNNLIGQKNSLLIKDFLEVEGTDQSPFQYALQSLEQLKAEATNEIDFRYFLLEDIIFSSLYATFYEHILISVKDNSSLAIGLIENFKQNTEEREQIIARQTQDHLKYIEAHGRCPGCASCENHGDVEELIAPWTQGDTDFFICLYLGMQTIQYSMEELLYESIPSNPKLIKDLHHKTILEFRQFVFDYVEKQLKA